MLGIELKAKLAFGILELSRRQKSLTTPSDNLSEGVMLISVPLILLPHSMGARCMCSSDTSCFASL